MSGDGDDASLPGSRGGVAVTVTTYEQARKRYRVDREAIVVESAEGASFVPRSDEDAWTDQRQAGVNSLLQRTRKRLAERR